MKSSHPFRFIVLFLCTITDCYVHSQQYISFDSIKGEYVTCEILESSEICCKMHFKIHGIHVSKFLNDKVSYKQLSLGYPFNLRNIGEPALPLITKLIKVPKGSVLKLNMHENCWREITMPTIYPAQEDFTDDEAQKKFVRNDSIYQSKSYMPEIVSMSERVTYRDEDFVILRFCPFKYYPKDNQLEILTDFNTTIYYTYTQPTSSKTNQIRLLNRQERPTDYLIIVGDIPNVLGSQAIKDLKMWKALKGYKTKIASTSETGSTYSNIKNYISQEYANSNHSLKYVLLIGESLKIPSGNTSSPYSPNTSNLSSDYWYGCMDGNDDRVADIAIGRIPIIYTDDIYNTVPKIIKYESLPFPHGKDVLLVTGQRDSSSFILCTETIRNNTYDTSFSFHTTYGGSGAWNQDVIDFANDGINILNYRGHAREEGWFGWNTHGEDFSGFDLNRFNQGTYFILMNVACDTGSLSFRFSMIYTFLTYEDAAAGFLGSLDESKHDANSSYNILFYQKLLNENIYNIGELNNKTHLANDLTQPDCYFNALVSICGGDPSLEIWTASPQEIQSVNVSVDSDSTFTLTAGVDSAKVSIVSENGDLIDLKDFNGYIRLAKPSQICYYAINKHNYLPYIFKIDPSSTIIQNVSFSNNTYLWNTPITIGRDVTTSLPQGDVTVKEGSTLSINKGSGVTIKNGFRVEKGASLIIQ